MVISVKILAKNYGDKSGQMTVQQFQDMKKGLKGNWTIFAQDTAEPGEAEPAARRIDAADVKDGMSVTMVPQIVGG